LELDAGDRITETIVTRRAETRIAGLGRAGLWARAIERGPTEGREPPKFFASALCKRARMSDGQPMPRYNLLNTVGSPDSATGVIDTMRGSFQRDAYRAVAAPSLRGSWDARGA